LTGNDGGNRLAGGDGDDTVSGGGGDDLLFGDAGGDSLSGDIGNDTLGGGEGSDTLSGGEGDDSVVGGGGADRLVGGAGADVFAITAVADSSFGQADALVGFLSGTDKIDLQALSGTFDFVGSGPFIAGDALLQVRFAASQVQIDFNNDGVFGAGDIQIAGISAIAEDDFLF